MIIFLFYNSVDKSIRATSQNYLTADSQLVVNLLMPYFVIERDTTDTLLWSAEVQIIDISSLLPIARFRWIKVTRLWWTEPVNGGRRDVFVPCSGSLSPLGPELVILTRVHVHVHGCISYIS